MGPLADPKQPLWDGGHLLLLGQSVYHRFFSDLIMQPRKINVMPPAGDQTHILSKQFSGVGGSRTGPKGLTSPCSQISHVE